VEADPEFAAANMDLASHFGYDSTQGHAYIQRARDHRQLLSREDRILLDAIEPALETPPNLSAVEARLVEALGRVPDAARIWYQLGLLRIDRYNLPGAIGAFENALRADPGLGVAAADRARVIALGSDLAAGRRAYEACVDAFPASSGCLLGRIGFDLSEGDFARAVSGARRLAALYPGSKEWHWLLAMTSYQDGNGIAESRAALRAMERVATRDRVQVEARNAATLAVLTGDFESARIHAKRWAEANADSHEAWDHIKPMMFRIDIENEIGAFGAAAFLSRDTLRKFAAWRGTGFSEKIFLLRGLYWSGALSSAGFARLRDVWIAEDNALQSTEGSKSGMPWLVGFVQPARTKRDAMDALRVEALYPNAPNVVFRGAHWDSAVGEIYRLAGDLAHAMPLLERGSASSEAIAFPFEYVWAQFHLGEGREDSGNILGACEAYAKVMFIWGSAPRSLTAELAARRMLALRCVSVARTEGTEGGSSFVPASVAK
jgi:tetratricopeptide (TPR) repeat protein